MRGGPHIPVQKSALVPLDKKKIVDGAEVTVPALFWMIDGTILVHPDRWDHFLLWITQPDVAADPEVAKVFGEHTAMLQAERARLGR